MKLKKWDQGQGKPTKRQRNSKSIQRRPDWRKSIETEQSSNQGSWKANQGERRLNQGKRQLNSSSSSKKANFGAWKREQAIEVENQRQWRRNSVTL